MIKHRALIFVKLIFETVEGGLVGEKMQSLKNHVLFGFFTGKIYRVPFYQTSLIYDITDVFE